MEPVARSMLYAFGPFYCNPAKPVLNLVFGDGYDVGYKHFRRDHSNGANIRMHFVAMIFQLLGNFALLNELDQKLSTHVPGIPTVGGVPINFTTTTAFGWSVALCLTPAPVICSILSVTSIGAAVWMVKVLDATMMLLYIEPAVIAVFLVVLFTSIGINKSTLGKLAFWSLWGVGWFKVLAHFRGAGTEIVGCDLQTYTLATTALLVVLAGVLKDPVKVVVVTAAVLLRMGGTFYLEPALHYWSCAYSAMGLQGASHDTSGQEATLLKLQGESSGAEKIAFEWSHVTYFPNMLFHSIYQSINAKKKV